MFGKTLASDWRPPPQKKNWPLRPWNRKELHDTKTVSRLAKVDKLRKLGRYYQCSTYNDTNCSTPDTTGDELRKTDQ